MKKLLLATAICGLFALPGMASAQTAPAAAAPTPEHTFTGNATLVSDYRFRGISQTFKLPAVQAGFDYAHSSGVYLGTWASNVTNNVYANGAGLEWDLYGGYKFDLAKDITADIGLLYYWYPGAKFNPAGDKYNNTELYGALSYGSFTAKYSHTLSDYFGMKTATTGGLCGRSSSGAVIPTNCFSPNAGDSKGSGYLDLAYNLDLGDKLTLGLHLGHQSVHNYGKASYTDYKIGLTKEYGGFLLGAAIVATNANTEIWRAMNGIQADGLKFIDPRGTTLVLSLGKTF
jgi:uncharacterized protein (TIGR02001 family)